MSLWPFKRKRKPLWAKRTTSPPSPPSIASPKMADFVQRLTEAISWCSFQVVSDGTQRSLRTPALSPSDIVSPQVYRENGEWWKLSEEAMRQIYGKAQIERRRTVLSLAEARADLLRQDGFYPDAPVTNLAGGRLLIYAPDEQFADGLAEKETGGFYDGYNVPPWDTWVAYVQEHDQVRTDTGTHRAYVICWIPPPFLDTASRGISVNPEGSIGWLSNISTNFVRELNRAGFSGQ